MPLHGPLLVFSYFIMKLHMLLAWYLSISCDCNLTGESFRTLASADDVTCVLMHFTARAASGAKAMMICAITDDFQHLLVDHLVFISCPQIQIYLMYIWTSRWNVCLPKICHRRMQPHSCPVEIELSILRQLLTTLQT